MTGQPRSSFPHPAVNVTSAEYGSRQVPAWAACIPGPVRTKGIMEFLVAILLVLTALVPRTGTANENPYETLVLVNDLTITRYDLDQRKQLMKALGVSGNLHDQAVDDLVDDRIRQGAARKAGLSATESMIDSGVAEFAARDNLSTEQLNSYVARFGVAPESVRDFIRARLDWQRVVQARYGASARVSETEVDAALALTGRDRDQKVLLSELVLSTAELGLRGAEDFAQKIYSRIHSAEDFEEYARRYSAASTARNGGRLDWIPVSSIPPQVATRILALEIGQVTGPIQVGDDAIGLFLLRNLREGRPDVPAEQAVSYISVPVPADGWSSSDTDELIAGVESCEDLQFATHAFGQGSVAGGLIDSLEGASDSLVAALSQLDPGEAAIHRTDAGDTSIVMVCRRGESESSALRDDVRQSLFGQRLTGFSESYLRRLRSEAFIEYR